MDLEEAYSQLQILNSEIKAVGQRKRHLSRVIFNVRKLINDAISDAVSKKKYYEIQWMTDKKQMLNANKVLLEDTTTILKLLASQKVELLSRITIEESKITRKEKAKNAEKVKKSIEIATKKRQEIKEANIKASQERDSSEFRILINLLKERFGIEWFVKIMDEVHEIHQEKIKQES